jgi:hypothetical protein
MKIDPRTNQIQGDFFLKGPSTAMLFAGKEGLIASEDTGLWRFTQAVCFWKIPYSIGEPPPEKK